MWPLLLSLFLTGSLALKDGHEDHKNCVDISYWDEVQHNTTIGQLCGYKMKSECIKRSQTVCRDIPVHSCKVVGYADCQVNKNQKFVHNPKVYVEELNFVFIFNSA